VPAGHHGLPVNAMDGQPFFVVNQVVDPGLIQVIEQEIVPRLK
jgi:hypothetical protein